MAEQRAKPLEEMPHWSQLSHQTLRLAVMMDELLPSVVDPEKIAAAREKIALDNLRAADEEAR